MAKSKPSDTQPEATGAAPRFVATVTARAHRRRAGFVFGPEPVHLREDQITAEIAAALEADPELSIRPYQGSAPTDGAD